LKIFEITLGSNRHIIVAKDAEEALERRAEVDATYDYLPVQVNELKIDGYDIVVEKKKLKKEDKVLITDPGPDDPEYPEITEFSEQPTVEKKEKKPKPTKNKSNR
jgi:alkanesulfonate monooxygenase SsuD/methylene tetrahydromethanopterin reductase-like flavin-dependent oxidoreductase (luciferase family)